jgi:hypothetical protein
MVWISLFFASFTLFAKEMPKFLTKHAIQSIRYISADGRYAYIQKKPGVLSLVSSFRSIDFISEASSNDFLVRDSRFKERLIIEIVPGNHHEFNVMKHSKIMVVDWGKTQTRLIGQGLAPKLHMNDEWVSYFDGIEKIIYLQNILTEKKFAIKLSPKMNNFYVPEVEMVSNDTLVYTDVNDKGYSALIQYNLVTQKGNVLYKSPQIGTKLELCQDKGYLAIGEFPYDDISHSSKVLRIKITSGTNLAGFETLYSSSDSDLGNIVCRENEIYFVKTLVHNRKINFKQTEAVKLDLKTTQVKTVTDISTVNQLISMDGRILIPFRGDFYVLEGVANLTEDKLKSPVNNNEELPLDF